MKANQIVEAYGEDCEVVADENSKAQFPMIVLQVPHQGRPCAYPIENEAELYEMAQQDGGDNWEFPGHFDEDENWIDETTIEDMKDAIAHDMSVCYFISEADFPSFDPDAHQGFLAREEVNRMAVFYDWLKPIENDA